MRRTKAAASAIIALIAAALLLTGCVSTTESTYEADATSEKLAGSLTDLFRQAVDLETNPFVIEVLERAIETGSIAQADYDEAHRLYRVCMADAGYEESYTQLPNGSYQITPPALEGDSAVEKYMDTGTECSAELAPIEALFITQQGNPDLLSDRELVVVQCLNKAGLVGGDYTPEDFRSDLDSAFASASFDPSTAEAQTCFSNAGYAVAIGEQ